MWYGFLLDHFKNKLTVENENQEDPFDLNYQFFLYLQKLGIHPKDLPVGQYGSIKRSFYAGLGQMMMLVSMNLSVLTPDAASERTLYLTEQITAFWKEESQRHTSVNN